VEALQAKLATRVAKLDKELIDDEVLADDEVLTDDEEHEEVFALGRMGTRSQTRVNQYFTNMEIEEENRIVNGRTYIRSATSWQSRRPIRLVPPPPFSSY